jgi:hypothetical protein
MPAPSVPVESESDRRTRDQEIPVRPVESGGSTALTPNLPTFFLFRDGPESAAPQRACVGLLGQLANTLCCAYKRGSKWRWLGNEV